MKPMRFLSTCSCIRVLPCFVILCALASCNSVSTRLEATVYPAMVERTATVAELSPMVASSLREKLDASEAAYLNGDTETAAAELVNALHSLGEIPDSPAADIAALEVVIAMEKDLHRLSAFNKDPDVSSSGRQWNMTCIGGGNFNCRVQRGRWCVQVYFKGNLVGCHMGKMVAAP